MSTIGLHLLNADGGGILFRSNPTGIKGRFQDNFVQISAFSCRRPFAPSGSELILAARLETKVTHITYVKPEIEIQRGDRLLIEGVTYDVTAVLPPSKRHHIKIMLEKRQYGAITT